MTATSAGVASTLMAGRSHQNPVAGGWPRPEPESLAALAGAVQRIPDGAAVLVDGLIASTAPEVLVPQARRLRLVVLVHMPLGHRPADGAANEVRIRESAVLSAADAVITTSEWCDAGSWSSTSCPPTGRTSPSPESTPPTWPPGPKPAPRCSASRP